MDVDIELKSSAVSDGDGILSVNVLGDMQWDGPCCTLSCDLLDEDGSTIHTCIRAEDGFVVIEQQGSRSSRLMVRKGERIVSDYATPYGALLVGVTGLHVEDALTPQGGRLALVYEVDVNAASVGANTIEILVRRTCSDE